MARKKRTKNAKQKPITNQEFDQAIEELLDEMSTSEILGVPGAYEMFSEELNNEAIDLAYKNRG